MDPIEGLLRKARLPDQVLRYGDHEEAVIDLHLPRADRPGTDGAAGVVVVLLHGGFWRQRYDRTHTRPLAEALAGEGFLVATPEYRRVGGGGGWPATFDDVAAAMHALPGLLSGLGVRTAGTTVAGHSAGGQLALWLAGEGLPLDRVVGLAPVGDLRAAARDRLGDGAVQALLGGEPDQVPERYDAADPVTRLERPPDCALVIVHGADDAQVPVGNSRGLVVRHPQVRLQELPGTGHFELVDPASSAWPAVREAVAGG